MKTPASLQDDLIKNLYRRFVIAFILLGMVLLVVSTVRGNINQRHYIDQSHIEVSNLATIRLNTLFTHWHQDAQLITNTLSLLQLAQLTRAEQPEMINAFFMAQGKHQKFEAIAITDAQHQPIFEWGCADAVRQLINSQANLIRAHCDAPAQDALYHVVELPLSLGKHGVGFAHFAKQISPAVLQEIAPTQGYAMILQSDMPVTSSTSKALTTIDLSDFMTVNVAWPSYEIGHTYAPAQLTLYRTIPLSEPWWARIMPPLLVVLFALVIIWLLLGRWMRHLSVRLNLLWSGIQAYAQTKRASEAKPYFNAFLNEHNTDDIARLGRAMMRMMHEVDVAREHEKIFIETLALLEEAVITLDHEGNILDASSGWQRLIRLASPTGERFIGFIHPDDREGWLLKSAQLLNNNKDSIHVRFRLNTQNASHPWLEGRFIAHHNDEQNTTSIRGALRDVTQSYLQEQQMTHMALHDALTGLANRILLEDRLQQALLLTARDDNQLAIIFFDLDHFKHVNDSLGHKVGDKLLIAISERIQQCLHGSDTLARWGGDEFVILLPDIKDTHAVKMTTDALMNAMQLPFDIDGNELSTTFSIGVALYPNDADDAQTLFSNADRAMFYAKNQGRNQTCFFADMNHKNNGKQELYIQNRLVNAVKTNQIEVYYQPIVNCESKQVHAVEALARWHDERYGWVSPATFVPMVENLGLICQMGQQVLAQSLKTLASWNRKGIRVQMAINVSSRQLFSPSFVPAIMTELQHNFLTCDQIILEVTESLALRDIDHAMTRLQELQQQGFRIAIDDFGTGHSSLAQLQEISADKLKIDRQFVMRLNNHKGHNMVKAVTHMAQALNLSIVAEGVETEEQRDQLCMMGVNFIQGFLFAKAMPEDECETWITTFNQKQL